MHIKSTLQNNITGLHPVSAGTQYLLTRQEKPDGFILFDRFASTLYRLF